MAKFGKLKNFLVRKAFDNLLRMHFSIYLHNCPQEYILLIILYIAKPAGGIIPSSVYIVYTVCVYRYSCLSLFYIYLIDQLSTHTYTKWPNKFPISIRRGRKRKYPEVFFLYRHVYTGHIC